MRYAACILVIALAACANSQTVVVIGYNINSEVPSIPAKPEPAPVKP